MSQFEGNFTDTQGLRLAIAIARFNDAIVTRLLAGCQDALKRHGIRLEDGDGPSQVDYAWVPGSFELPLVTRTLAASGQYDAVIALGAIIRGDTPHFDYVAAEAAKGLAAVALQTGTPVIFGVLTVDTMQQAFERAGVKSNLGWNYAMNALEMATLMRQMRANIPA